MKHYYYFCACSGALTAETPWFKIPFGESARDKRFLSEFNQLAKSTDFYFARVSVQADEFLDRVAGSLCAGLQLPRLALTVAVANPAAVLRALRGGVSLSALCGSYCPSLRLAADSSYRTKIRNSYGKERIS